MKKATEELKTSYFKSKKVFSEKTRILSITNQKGGVGKTTLTFNLGFELSRMGYKVALVDNDPQGNLSSFFNFDQVGEKSKFAKLDEIYLMRKSQIESISFHDRMPEGIFLKRQQDTLGELWCIPSDSELTHIENYLSARESRESILKAFFDTVLAKKPFDFVLIDNAPSQGLLVQNAWVASTGLIVPIQPEYFSLEGIVKVQKLLEFVKDRFNPELKIVGFILNQVQNRRKLAIEVESILRNEFADLVFESKVDDSAVLAESSGHAKSAFEYDRRAKGSEQVHAAAHEFLVRLSSQNGVSVSKEDQVYANDTESNV